MPKKPTDSLLGIRFEMNETERDALRFYTTSAVVRNVGQGVGAVAKPVLDNLAYILAAVVAVNGWDYVKEQASGWQTNSRNNRRAYKVERYEEYLQRTDDDPALTYDEYTEQVTEKSYDYRAAHLWDFYVGQPLRRFLGAEQLQGDANDV